MVLESCDRKVPTLAKFKPATLSEVKGIIARSPSKSCLHDNIPTFLLKSCLDELLLMITKIVNLSLSAASVPTSFKRAVVTSIIKKPTLDPDIFANY